MTLACFHRFMEGLEKSKAINACGALGQEYVSTDAAGLLKNAPKINPCLQ